MDPVENPPPDPQPAATSDDAATPENIADLNKTDAPAQSQSLQVTVQALTDQALHFLSNASNETIGACLVGLGATTYLVLGRVGLVLMGVVGGVVLHATWEGSIGAASGVAEAKAAEEKRRREVAIDVVKRALTWQSNKRAEQNGVAPERIEFVESRNLNYNAYPPETAAALTELTDAIIRDYVRYVNCY
jgi:hypothetical protein